MRPVLGGRGGEVRSAKTSRAVRASRRVGERRSKFQVGDATRANEQAPRDYRDRRGLVTELGPNTSEYRVEFDDGRQPTTGYLVSAWLDRVADG
jgi:hypothetical protein